MFKLSSFLVVFVLAGLCFGPSSEDDSSSGNEASPGGGGTGDATDAGAPSGNGALPGEGGDNTVGNGDPSLADSAAGGSDSQNESQGVETNTRRENHTLGHSLPDFIGDLDKKKEYVTKLQSICSTQHQTHKINEEKINFANCTYTCIKLGNPLVHEETRIPPGMICNVGDTKCPKDGPCPSPPLPSC
uniref:Putative ixodes 8-cys protein n=1 Tax=Ixodes ricinus TaxID=34613 RepID=A0A0K8R4P2_IXORI